MRSDQDNATLHAYSIGGMAIVLVVLTFAGWAADRAKVVGCFSKEASAQKEDLSRLEPIEASLSYRKAKPKAQPQKEKRAPDPVVKKEGVTRDETLKPVEKPKDEPVTKPDAEDPLAKYRRENQDEDLEVGKTEDQPGDFNDNKYGFAEETKGDPYLGELLGQLLAAGGEFPALASSEGEAVPCLHLDRDGKIVDTKFKTKSGNQEFDDFIERALKKFEKIRNADDNEDRKPVPSKLYPLVDEGWICFKIAP